jgi:mutual gliding-motility protein MglA
VIRGPVALFDYDEQEVIAKVVYFGPERAGKTTNLRHIHAKLAASNKSELAIVTTETGGRALVFDFIPPELGYVRGLRMRVQLCTVSGDSMPAQRAVLKRVDGIVFVADSQAAALDSDAQSLETLQSHLSQNHREPPPIVMQYNKRDLATALPVETLRQRLNARGLPSFEAIASEGIGVDETLRVITRACFRAVFVLYGAEGVAPPQATPEPPGATTLPVADAPRQARIQLSKRDLAGPPRRPTHQSLAGKSLRGTPARRSETPPLTKVEALVGQAGEVAPEEPPPSSRRGPAKGE